MKIKPVIVLLSSLIVAATGIGLAQTEDYWPIHLIGTPTGGADGPRLCDVNGDGLPDFSCGWEGAGEARIHINPGPEKVREKWPSIDIKLKGEPEDAMCVDLDGDGFQDVVACLDGGKAVEIHFAPSNEEDYMDASKWSGGTLPCSKDFPQAWMYAVAMDVDGKNGIDFVTGGKENAVGWFESPANPRNLADWKFYRIADPQGSWTMDIHLHDIDGDGLLDILNTRKLGLRTGAYFYLNPGPNSSRLYKEWEEVVLVSGSPASGGGWGTGR